MFPHSLTWVKWPSFMLPQGICSLLLSYHVTLKAFIPWYYSCNFSASFKLYPHKKLYPPTLTAAAAKSLPSCPTLCNPIDGSPLRLCHPWDSPGKNAGVGCHFLLQCMKLKSQSEVAQSCPTLSDPMDCSLPGSSVHRIFQARVLESGAIAFSTL